MATSIKSKKKKINKLSELKTLKQEKFRGYSAARDSSSKTSKPTKADVSKVGKGVTKASKKLGQIASAEKKKLALRYGNLTKTNLESLKVQELRSYIKRATELVNKSAPTFNKASLADYTKAIRIIGKDPKKPTVLGLGKNKTKATLKAQAEILQNLMRGDSSSSISEEFKDIIKEKAYQSFKKSPKGIKNISREDYDQILDAFAELDDLLEEYGSATAKKLIYEYVKQGYSGKTIGQVMRATWEEHLGEDIDAHQLLMYAVDGLKGLK